MGTDSWGQVTVPLWALRFKAVKLLINQYGEGLSSEDLDAIGEYQFASQVFVRNDEFPEHVHETLQALQIPYDYGFALEMDDGGTRAGGWRPGMRAPLEYPTLYGERVFTQGELRDILAARGPRPRRGAARTHHRPRAAMRRAVACRGSMAGSPCRAGAEPSD